MTTPQTQTSVRSRATPGLAPSQTVGPFFLGCLLREDARRNVLVQPGTRGERVRIEGSVLDGDGAPIPDALVEIWQANAAGRYRHPADRRTEAPLDPAFSGFGRSGTDDDGRYWFETVKPGAAPFDGVRMQAPHICVMVFARGLLNHLATRLYFADDPATQADPVLRLVPLERRATLLAAREPTGAGNGIAVYRFDIVLQGAHETVFFNL
jgi:protocatechuate 3,4-dioxygenase alpha subunit